MNKILYLTYDGLTDPLGQSQILPYLIKLSFDNEIHIISAEKKDNFIKFKDDINLLIDNSNIYWHSFYYSKSPPILSTVFDLYRIYLKSIRLHKIFNFSIVHCRSHLTAIIGHYLKKKKDIPYIFDMRSFFPEERIDGGHWPQNIYIFKVVFSYFKHIERIIFRTADHIVVLTESAKNILDIEDKRISVIPCCADFDYFDFNKITQKLSYQAKKSLGIKQDSFVLSYLGSVGTWYLLEEMLDFFKVLKKSKSDSVFLFITPSDPDFIVNIAVKKGIDKGDIFVKFAPRKELPVLISLSSVSIFFIKNTFSKKASSPTKQAELMGLGIPVIANSGIGDVDNVILKTESGKVINISDPSPYKEVCFNIDKLLEIKKEKIRKNGMAIFALEIGVNHYRKIYSRLEQLN
jgi:glycosyltransferase involved in cell wall biosynthesis